jgi:hypothetical protein
MIQFENRHERVKLKCGAGGQCPGQSKKPNGPIQEEGKGYGRKSKKERVS